MWKQRLTNMCQNLRLTQTDLVAQKQEQNHKTEVGRKSILSFRQQINKTELIGRQ